MNVKREIMYNNKKHILFLGDSMKYHDNQRFSTFDQDNVHNCAEKHKGAWWYDNCKYSNLNGIYYKGTSEENDGLTWYHWKGYHESLEWTEIKIRPKINKTEFSRTEL